MTGWSTADLAACDTAEEMRVAGRRADGSPRRMTIIWQVVVDGQVFVRSVKGETGQWFVGVRRHDEGSADWGDGIRPVRFVPDAAHDDAVDTAYLAKYGPGPNTQSIIAERARATTLRVEPR